MKLIDYIHHLQQLYDKHGDVDTEVNIKTKYVVHEDLVSFD